MDFALPWSFLCLRDLVWSGQEGWSWHSWGHGPWPQLAYRPPCSSYCPAAFWQSQECHPGHPPWGYSRPHDCQGQTESSAGLLGGPLGSVRSLPLLSSWPGVIFPLLLTQKRLPHPTAPSLCAEPSEGFLEALAPADAVWAKRLLPGYLPWVLARL